MGTALVTKCYFSKQQDYEVGYLAGKFGLSPQDVRQLIARVGNDREKIDQAARELKSA